MGPSRLYIPIKMLTKIARTLNVLVFIIAIIIVMITVFFVGYSRGYISGKNDTETLYQKYLSDKVSSITKPVATGQPVSTPTASPRPTAANFSGPELWDAINKARVQNGVNHLSVKEEICTIASIRLNQLLELRKLDGHVGFTNMPTDRPDLKYIFDQYNLSEFLVSDAASAQDAVDLWLNTLGHKELLTGGQYVWGCAYAQNGFGVAIAAY